MGNRSPVEPANWSQQKLENWPPLVRSRPEWTSLFGKWFVNIASSEKCALSSKDAIPADQFVEAAEFLLARNPLIGTQTEDPVIWALPMAPIRDAQIVLYYAFNDSTVWLMSIARV
jgi:hypothetical protein